MGLCWANIAVMLRLHYGYFRAFKRTTAVLLRPQNPCIQPTRSTFNWTNCQKPSAADPGPKPSSILQPIDPKHFRVWGLRVLGLKGLGV